jgi:hypothetical protein
LPRVRVLSIDGGGIRGIIPALVLAELEERTGRPAAEHFGLIAGTSTGGILAAALALPGAPFSARDLVALYEREGPEIFSRSLLRRIRTVEGLLDERYDDDALVDALRRYLGEARLAQVTTDVFVTAYDLERRGAFFFRSSRARTDAREDHLLVDVVRATSAAPTYFEPQVVTDVAGATRRVLVDGGVFAPNPAMCAYAELARAGRAPEVELVVALGTGSLTRPLRYEDVRGWGALEWARPVIDVVFDGVADTVDFQLAQLLGPEGYVRLQVDLRQASDDLDDASEGNLAALRAEAARLLREQAPAVDRLVRVLGGDAA